MIKVKVNSIKEILKTGKLETHPPYYPYENANDSRKNWSSGKTNKSVEYQFQLCKSYDKMKNKTHHY